jgi:two-component system sensor histidine kinase EvgS
MKRIQGSLALSLALSLTLLLLSRQASEAEAAVLPTPPILAGCEPDYPPYCIVTENGEADGFSVELLRSSLKALALDIAFKTAPWPELKQDLADGRLQVLPLVGRTPEREALYDFTFPYLTMHGAIVVRKDRSDIASPADLKGKRVAVLRGDNAEEYLLRANLGADIVPLPSFEAALRDLSAGRYDAVVIQKLLALQLIQIIGLDNLAIAGPPLKDFTQSFCFAVRKGDANLLAALNEGLSVAMVDGTFRHLYAKWFAPIEATDQPRSRIIVGGGNDCPPYEYLDSNGQPAGLNVDLTRALARQMGLSVEIRLGSWETIRAGLEAGEIDVVQGMFYSAERDGTYDFSPPTLAIQHAVTVRRDSPKLETLADLAGKRILVIAGDILEDLAIKKGYEKQLLPVPSQEEALRRLAEGQGDCALVATIPALYWIRKNKWDNLRVSHQPVLLAESCYAVAHGKNEQWLNLFSEGLAGLKATGEYRAIKTKWLGPYEPSDIDTFRLIKYGLAIIVPLFILLGGAVLWSYSLRRRVAERTRALTAEIADRKRAEEALVQSEAYIKTIMDNLPIGIAVNSLDPGVSFTYMNDHFPAIYRTTREALTDHDAFWNAVYEDPACREKLKRRILADCASGNPAKMRWENVPITRKGAETSYISARNTPVPGKALMISTVWDVTERKQAELERAKLEAQLRQAQKMESVGRLAGGVAHDFNNLLMSILGYAELCQERLAADHPVRPWIDEITACANRSAAITRQLLAFARKQPVAPRLLDLNAAIPHTIGMLRPLIGENIELAWQPLARPATVKMDPTQLDQILTNLAVNARDAIAGVGRLTIATGNAALSGADCIGLADAVPGRYVTLTVSDTGHGIDKETIEHLFEPFFTTKGIGEGTGLGLATVYGIAKQNNGFVTVSSEPGKGASFTLHLPLHEGEAPAEADPPKTPQLRKGSETVLLVEDEPINLFIGRKMLEGLGYTVLATSVPSEAIRLAEEQAGGIALLLTDVVMPGMSGQELSNRLKASHPEIKCLFMSGYTANMIAQHGILDEDVNFLSKPFSRAQLAAKLREVLDRP